MKDKNERLSYNPDVTDSDLQALKERKDLINRKKEVDFAGKDLDIPERKTANNTTKKDLKDEENTLHSKGSENNENLERSLDI